jgi:GT2 family glycosyltransferase
MRLKMTEKSDKMSNSHSLPDSEIRVSVVVPVYKGGESFRSCMKAMRLLEPAPEEVIVVADGGFDAGQHPEEQPGVKIIETPVRGGPAKARNIGAQAAQGNIILFIDADVVVKTDIIKRVRDIFLYDPELAALIGSYDDSPGEKNFLSQYRNLLHHYVHQKANEKASTFWGACGAVRRDIFLKLGGFDEDIRRPAMEDIEFGYRIKQGGYKIRLDKSLQVKHLKHWSALSILETDFFQRALPWTEFILKYRQFLNDLNIDISSRVSVALVFCMPVTLISALFWPKALALIPILVLLLLYINLDLYKFFYQKRGMVFTLKVIPWHWLYFFYSGLGFMLGYGRHTVLEFIQRH